MRIRSKVSDLPLPPTLRANEQVAARRVEGKHVLHMGFGAAPEHLVLRRSMCDYDGGKALGIAGDRDDLERQVDTMAPRVIEAAEAIAKFVKALH